MNKFWPRDQNGWLCKDLKCQFCVPTRSPNNLFKMAKTGKFGQKRKLRLPKR